MFEVLLLLGFFAAGVCQLLPPALEADGEKSGASRQGATPRAGR
jgi:hypothetical protein